MEMCQKIRQRIRGGEGAYDQEQIAGSLRAKNIEVLPFDREQAERAAEWLDSCFQSAESWREAKRRQCVEQLGLRPEDAPGKRCSATVDWLIASYACLERHIVVAEDTGREFCGVGRKMGIEGLERLLGALLRG